MLTIVFEAQADASPSSVRHPLKHFRMLGNVGLRSYAQTTHSEREHRHAGTTAVQQCFFSELGDKVIFQHGGIRLCVNERIEEVRTNQSC